MDRRLTPATDRIALRGWGIAREALTEALADIDPSSA